MKFETMPRIYPEMAMWGAMSGPYTFVISRDGDDPFLASVKMQSARPFDHSRTDLGSFDRFEQAQQACEQWLKYQKV